MKSIFLFTTILLGLMLFQSPSNAVLTRVVPKPDIFSTEFILLIDFIQDGFTQIKNDNQPERTQAQFLTMIAVLDFHLQNFESFKVEAKTKKLPGNLHEILFFSKTEVYKSLLRKNSRGKFSRKLYAENFTKNIVNAENSLLSLKNPSPFLLLILNGIKADYEKLRKDKLYNDFMLSLNSNDQKNINLQKFGQKLDLVLDFLFLFIADTAPYSPLARDVILNNLHLRSLLALENISHSISLLSIQNPNSNKNSMIIPKNFEGSELRYFVTTNEHTLNSTAPETPPKANNSPEELSLKNSQTPKPSLQKNLPKSLPENLPEPLINEFEDWITPELPKESFE